MATDYERFKIWYIEPLFILKDLPNAQGGFIALTTSCILYERYAKAVLIANGKKAGKLEMVGQLASDFGIDKKSANAFWEVIRDGLAHQGMPMQKKGGKSLPLYAFHDLYPTIALEEISGKQWLKVQCFHESCLYPDTLHLPDYEYARTSRCGFL